MQLSAPELTLVRVHFVYTVEKKIVSTPVGLMSNFEDVKHSNLWVKFYLEEGMWEWFTSAVHVYWCHSNCAVKGKPSSFMF